MLIAEAMNGSLIFRLTYCGMQMSVLRKQGVFDFQMKLHLFLMNRSAMVSCEIGYHGFFSQKRAKDAGGVSLEEIQCV